ncbi:unnamed protein product [Psylliodes chrysocephalus]|uniref:Protein white n=1 Tax=Psylliodes chrysocephalus TaxID=3402493 RepID=A0A9P0G9B2_9CUCU|nr:unnamed protein product [Psylliodes chrysocephala]
MNEEKVPLLGPGPSRRPIKFDEPESSGSSDSLSVTLQSIEAKSYGTSLSFAGKIVQIEDRITYTWNNINVFVNCGDKSKRKFLCFGKRTDVGEERKHILRNVNGIAYPGELLAVLGSSGSGKTTLLNALTYRSSKEITITGTRCINGVPVNYKKLTGLSAYVQQDDLFIPTLTVKEHLIFQMKRVEEVISEFVLKKCEHTQIGFTDQGGLSGGEKKRLSFAAEVLTNPVLMFCDEPTSGLDSFMALNVLQALKNMTQTGKTVICTIHQPSSELYAMFDKLMLMSEGQVAFLGTSEEADLFFRSLQAPCPRNYNPADYYIQLLAVVPGREESCRQAAALICEKFYNSPIGIRQFVESAVISTPDTDTLDTIWFTGENKSPYKASWWTQFRAVLWRSWLSLMKDPLIIKVRTFQTMMTSLLIGLIYYGQETNQNGVMNINGVLFIFLTNMTFQNVFAVIHVFTSEMIVFLREHRNGMYRTDVYFLSKTLAELPFFIILPVLFTSVCYYLIGLNSNVYRFLITCGIVTLVANASLSYGYLVSCVSSNTSVALTIGAPMIIPFLLFGGYFMNINSIPIYFRWLSYLSWFKYGNEALMINQWEDVTEIDCGQSTVCPRNGHVVLESYSFNEENFAMDLISLVVLIILFRFLAFMALLRKTCQK